jgi:hypothetical protein
MLSSCRIIVTGLITQHPLMGGITWHHLQYLLGLKALGHDVYYFEDSGEFPYNLDGGPSGSDWIARDCTDNVAYLAQIMDRFGFENRWAYHFPLRSEWFGLSEIQRKTILDSADLLINVSGSLEHPKRYRRIPHLVYIDTDPVITQIKIASGKPEFRERVEAHDTHFTFGESLSERVPETKYRWRPTRQPIVLSEWRPNTPRRKSFTTVMNWTSYEPLVYSGRTYGQKDIEFRRFLELPARVSPTALELAISRVQYLKWQAAESDLPGDPGESERTQTNRPPAGPVTYAGWRVVDAIEVCGNLDSYRRYIESSKAEWSVAKNAYVIGQPGWFSERSACYLAAGRPVVVQDTGFAGALPVGEGILSFRDLSEAAAAIREVEADYSRHADAARATAETSFDSDKVLSHLIDRAMSDRGEPREGAQRKGISGEMTSTIHASLGDSRQPDRKKKRSPKPKAVETITTNLLEHPAVEAWAELQPERVEPDQIEVLKLKKKGSVYRLDGVGPGGSAVIAKRCRHERAVTERLVYEEVLPRLAVSTLRYHGCWEEADDRFWWLFLEDVGDEPYSPLVQGHSAAAAEWLGTMHAAAADLPVKNLLTDRGPDHHLAYLRSAGETIPRIRVLPSLEPTERTVLQNIVSLCEFLGAQWAHLERFCDRMPRTFSHGDCLAKNVHVRGSQSGLTIAVFDWGGAGWGLPATDLGQLALPYRDLPASDPDCATYLSAVRERWPKLDTQTVQQLANLGQMFWSLKVISRCVPQFDYEGAHIESIVSDFNLYGTVLADSIRSARWMD